MESLRWTFLPWSGGSGSRGGGRNWDWHVKKKKEKKLKNNFFFFLIRKCTEVEIVSMSRAYSQKQDVADQLTAAQLPGLKGELQAMDTPNKSK